MYSILLQKGFFSKVDSLSISINIEPLSHYVNAKASITALECIKWLQVYGCTKPSINGRSVQTRKWLLWKILSILIYEELWQA